MDFSTYDSLYSNYDISQYARTPITSEAESITDIVDTAISMIGPAIGAAIAGFLSIIIFLSLVVLVLQIIANWKLFTKAGEKGWKAIIPFYSTAILFKISGMSPWLVLLYLGMIIPVVNFFVAIAIAVLSLYQPINLAKAFKKSTGFTVGMIMFPFVFNLILGFGKSEYYGFDEDKPAETVETKAE